MNPLKRVWQGAKIFTRFVFGQSQLYDIWGFGNADEPTTDRQRRDYRGLFFKCINIRADQITSAMMAANVVRVIGPDETEEVEFDHPWAERLRRPIPALHTDDFWRWVSLSRDLLGHSHSIVSGYDRIMGTRVPAGFLPIYSEFGDLNPVPDPRGGVKAWEYMRADGHKRRFDPEEVLALRRSSPYNPYKTLSLIQAALYELDLDLYMKTYRRDSVDKGGLSSVALSTDQQLTDTQRKQLAQEFKQYMGKRGVDKAVAFSHGMKPVNYGMDARDLQYIEGNVQNANDLRFITGIPEALFSKDANRAVLEGSERVMIQYTIQPEVNILCQQLTTEFERIFGADPGALRIEPPDLTPIDEELEIKRRETWLRTGQRTIDEYRAEDGKQEYPGGIGSEPLVSFSQAPLREVVTLNDEFSGQDPPPDGEGEDGDRSIKKKYHRDLDLDYHWRVIDRHRRREERKTAGSVNRVFDQMREAALDNIDSRRNVRAEQPILSVEQVLNLVEAQQIVDEGLRDDIIRLIREGFKRGAFNAQAEGLEFQMSTPQVRRLLRAVAAKTKGIADTTIDELSETIREAVTEGESLDEMADRVSEYFADAKRRRTRMIAQTMTTASFEGGQLISFRRAGATAKSWLSQRDGRVREDHEIADSSQNDIPLGDPFMVGGEALMHPGDPSASASNVIFCRCSMLPVIEGEDE